MKEETDLFGASAETAQEQTASAVKKPSRKIVHQVNVESLLTTLSQGKSTRLSDHFIPDDDDDQAKEQADPIPEDAVEAPEELEELEKKEEPEEEQEDDAPASADGRVKQFLAVNGMASYLKDYLDKAAATNAEFAAVYANPDKNIIRCVMYICEQVFRKNTFQGNGFATVRNDEVEGMAMHYYQEKDLQPSMKDTDNVALAVLLQGFAVPEEDIKLMKEIAREEKRREIVKEEGMKYANQIRTGEIKIELTDEEKAEIHAAGRQALIEQAAEKQKKSSIRRSTRPAKEEKPVAEATLF